MPLDRFAARRIADDLRLGAYRSERRAKKQNSASPSRSASRRGTSGTTWSGR